jgi:uncharacterized RDD family membrane protein YckC
MDEQKSSTRTIKVVGFGRRLAASLLDALFLGFLSFLLVTALGFVALFIGIFRSEQIIPFDTLIILVTAIFALVYYVTYWSKSGQTLGKSMLGIKVVDQAGSPPSTGKAILRFVGYLISAVVFSLGFVWIAFDQKRQGWHDKIAGTYVVEAETEPFEANAAQFVSADRDRRWAVLAVWVVLLIIGPGCLLGSLLLLGPVISAAVTELMRTVL